jgi:hypothetical protein
MRAVRNVCVLAGILLCGPTLAQGAGCEGLTMLPLPRWVVEERATIRLDNEARRNDYAQSIMQKGDKLFLARGGLPAETGLKFSSLYTRMLGDPENARRYFSTQSEARRAAEIRQQLFGVKGAGEFGRSAPRTELAAVSDLLTEPLLRRWQSEDWIGDFPALVINRAPPSRFRELMVLEQNAGDFLADERNIERSALMALGDGAINVHAEFVSKQGFLTARSYPTMTSALYDLQVQKPELCGAYFRLTRYWVSRPFLERYAASYRVGDVHLHGQIPIWQESSRASIRDLNIFPLLRDSFFIAGAFFAVKGDRIVLERWSLEPLVSTLQ